MSRNLAVGTILILGALSSSPVLAQSTKTCKDLRLPLLQVCIDLVPGMNVMVVEGSYRVLPQDIALPANHKFTEFRPGTTIPQMPAPTIIPGGVTFSALPGDISEGDYGFRALTLTWSVFFDVPNNTSGGMTVISLPNITIPVSSCQEQEQAWGVPVLDWFTKKRTCAGTYHHDVPVTPDGIEVR